MLVKKVFVDVISNFKKYALSIAISLSLFLIVLIIANQLHNNSINKSTIYFPNDIIYIPNEIDELDDAIIENTPYLQVPKDSDITYDINPGILLDGVNVDINKLKPLKETSDALLKKIKLQIENDQTLISYDILYNINSPMINEVVVPNKTYNIDKIISGKYPEEENEVLIPETLALYLANENGLKSYGKLIGFEFQYNGSNYLISGVYASSNIDGEKESVIINPPSEYTQELGASFVRVNDNSVKQQLLLKYTDALSSEVNVVDYSKYFIILAYIFINYVYYLLIKDNLSNTIEIFNHYNKSFINYYPYAVSFLLLNLLLLFEMIVFILI